MFKVLKEIAENTNTGSRSDLAFTVGGRVRDGNLKEMIAKQLKGEFNQLEGQGQVCTKTGRIKSKAVKKEKTQEQMMLQELKGMAARLLGVKGNPSNPLCPVESQAEEDVQRDSRRHPGDGAAEDPEQP